MTVVLAVLLVAGYVVHEVRAARRNRRFSASPVVVVSSPSPRWWQRAIGQVREAVVALAMLAVLLLLASTIHSGPRTHPEPTPGPSTPAAGTASATPPTRTR